MNFEASSLNFSLNFVLLSFLPESVENPLFQSNVKFENLNYKTGIMAGLKIHSLCSLQRSKAPTLHQKDLSQV